MARSPFTGQEQVYAHPGQWWEISFELPPLHGEDAGDWIGTLLYLNGKEGIFRFKPTDATPKNALAGSLTVLNILTGREGVEVDGITAASLSIGDWINIGTGLYRVTLVNSVVSGAQEVWVWPALRSDVEVADPVYYADPFGYFRLFDDFEWDSDVAQLHGFTIGAREVVI